MSVRFFVITYFIVISGVMSCKTVPVTATGWIDENTYRHTAIGLPAKTAKDENEKKSTARRAAILNAQYQITDVFKYGDKKDGGDSKSRSGIESTGVYSDFETTDLAIKQGILYNIKEGSVVFEKYDYENDAYEVNYEVRMEKLKKLVPQFFAEGCYSYDLDNYIYSGCSKGNCENGSGTYIWSSKNKYVGKFKNGKKNGYGVYTSYSDKYEGYWKDDLYNGKGTLTAMGNKYTGNWKDEKREGPGTQTYSDGEYIKYTGYWKDDKYNGNGTLTWRNKTKYIGEFKNGLKHGPGKVYEPNGKVLMKGNWEDDKFTGQ